MCDYDLVKLVVSKSFEKYGSYAHAAGYLESTLAGLLAGNDSANDVRRRLNAMIEQLENEKNG